MVEELNVLESGTYRVPIDGYFVTISVKVRGPNSGVWVHSSDHPKFPEAMQLVLEKEDPWSCGEDCLCSRYPWTVIFQPLQEGA
jgi:hypothetical protein